MTRLKDALDKADTRTDNPAEPVGALEFSSPALVPDGWQVDAVDTMRETTTEHVAVDRADGADGADDAPEVDDGQGGQPPAPQDVQDVGVRPNPSGDFWAAYQFGKQAIGKVVVGPHADAGLVEQYRRLAAVLHHHQLQGGARTLMVTSAVAEEGKTLTATNLALTLSHSYMRRVLLVDADLRRPSIHKMLGLPNVVGLSDRLRQPDRCPLQFRTVSPTLSVLTAGRPDADPMAGLVSDTMSKTLLAAAEQFDWVIVDTPPVALLTDANLLAAMIDTALLVVGAETTPYPMVRRAVDSIGEQRILGVILNRMSQTEIVSGYNTYGYGRYHYGIRKRRGHRLFFWKRSEPVGAAG